MVTFYDSELIFTNFPGRIKSLYDMFDTGL